MKNSIFSIISIMFSFIPILSWGATYNAGSCSQAAVSAAVGLASSGDTINIPACPSGQGWSTGLTITKGITIQGAGAGQTVLVDNTSSGPMLAFDVNGADWRVTGIEFRGGSGGKQWSYILFGGGNSHAFRIDNCKFYDWKATIRAIWLNGDLWGVIDSNVFDTNNQFIQAIQVQHSNWGGLGSYGDNSWADGDYLGSNKFVFIEDNTFIGPEKVAYSGIVDSLNGARIVVRYNTIDNDFVVSHGTESGGRGRGLRAFEVYNNKFNHNGGAWFTANYIRSGTGVIYNNTINSSAGSEMARAALFQNFRSTGSYAPWGQCTGSNAYDQNAGSPAGYACIDQPGRGKGDLMYGTNPTPQKWPNQALSPIYVWSNTGYSSNQADSDSVHVVLNRDYYVGTAKPGYSAYTYPHPLRSGGGSSPLIDAPTGLKVIPK